MSERVHACTGCGLCDLACGYPQSEAIQSMKNQLFEAGYGPPSSYAKIIENAHQTGNPYGESNQSAAEFLLAQPESQSTGIERLYFIGCTELYREREQVENVLHILRKANVSFGLLSENFCCGSPIYRVGDVGHAKHHAGQLVEQLVERGTKEIILSCSGCFSMFSNVYEDLVVELPSLRFIHITEVLDELVRARELKLGKIEKVVTYHDPCHLGRHSGMYDEPRNVIKAIPGVTLVEMEWNGKFSHCCGAGGGLKAGRADDAVALGAMRVREAEATGAQILVTSCPFCLRNLRDGADSIKSDIEISSVVSLLMSSMTNYQEGRMLN
jgi:heterodisulfide reductase subunit D